MEENELHLDELGEEKTALFIITSDTTKTLIFMATTDKNCMYTYITF